MRKLWLTLIASLAVMLLGFLCGKLYVHHIFSGPDDPLRFLNYVSVALLSVACIAFISVSGYSSRKLEPGIAIVVGTVLLVVTFGVGRLILSIMNVHDWSFMLLFIPIISFACGCLLLLVGTARALIKKLRQPPTEL